MEKLTTSKAGLGPDPGKYKGPPVDFEQAAIELEEEEPRWTSCSEDIWEERQREREAQVWNENLTLWARITYEYDLSSLARGLGIKFTNPSSTRGISGSQL